MTPTGWMVRDGLRIALHDASGHGLPVVFQHGLCGDARQTAEAFPEGPRFRRITLECRGHGASEAGHDLSIATFAGDIAAMIDALPETRQGPVVLGGISMGAAIACRLAVTRPDLVRALILVRPAWITDTAPASMAPNAEVGDLLARLPRATARAVFEAGLTARSLAVTAPDNLGSLRGFFDRQPQDETARLLTAIAADGPGIVAADLGSLGLPVLVCGTAEDAVHPLPMAQALAALIPGARFSLLPPKGRDKPAHLAALHRAISTFLMEI